MRMDDIKAHFPLHYYVWHNDKRGLVRHLHTGSVSKDDLEKKDGRGRTALMLAIVLNRRGCAALLIKRNASIDTHDSTGFTALQEALATSGNRKFCHFLARKYVHQQFHTLIRASCQTMTSSVDFYAEIDLEFSTWLPLVGFILPNDKITIYKRGSGLRIDYGLVINDDESSIANAPWKRERVSTLFRQSADGTTAHFYSISHDQKVYDELKFGADDKIRDSPTLANFLDKTYPMGVLLVELDKLRVERTQAGIFRAGDRSDTINGYECAVYSLTDVEVRHHSRIDHLNADDRQLALNAPINRCLSVLGINTRQFMSDVPAGAHYPRQLKRNPHNLSLIEYFDEAMTDDDDEGVRDVGKPRDLLLRTKCSRGKLWLARHYPLSVREHLLPILKLLALSDPYYKSIIDVFEGDKLPQDGFPVKIEMSIFKMLKAKLTFGNLFAGENAAPGVYPIKDGRGRVIGCTFDDQLFEPPWAYEKND